MTQVTVDGKTENVTRDFTEYPYKYFTKIASLGADTVLTGGATSLTDEAYYAVCVKVCPNDDNILTVNL